MRILTLNCWNISPPYAERLALIREGIERLAPDLIGMQEIIVRRDGVDMGADILDGLGYESAFGAAFRWSEAGGPLPHDAEGDAFGNLVASRFPIERSAVHELPGVETGERRSVVATHVVTPHGRLAFLTTHFLAFAAALERERRIEGLHFLQVELGADREPTYRFAPGVAKTSLAGQTAARLGVTGEALLALVEKNAAS